MYFIVCITLHVFNSIYIIACLKVIIIYLPLDIFVFTTISFKDSIILFNLEDMAYSLNIEAIAYSLNLDAMTIKPRLYGLFPNAKQT